MTLNNSRESVITKQTMPVCLLGLPVHSVALPKAHSLIKNHASAGEQCFLSTPNLNFLVASRHDDALRRSVVLSDLSIADGTPLIWLARLLGVQLPGRVAGSDVFEALRKQNQSQLSVFFFGGQDDAAQTACEVINGESGGLRCVGALNPGFGDIETMSSPAIIDAINASGADFLVVSLGAAKGQAWILRNLLVLKVPVISHLGAVVNFVAGRVARAPRWMQRTGLEWCWRIIEEPALWRRYFFDGLGLLQLAATQALPYALWLNMNQRAADESSANLELDAAGDVPVVTLPPVVSSENADRLTEICREALDLGKGLRVNMAQVSYIDSAGLGLILWLEHHVLRSAGILSLANVSHEIARVLRWNNLTHLVAQN